MEGQGQEKAPIGSSDSEGKDKGDPLEKISGPSGLPALEELLGEFLDVFPEDLPAETSPEREITMWIPIMASREASLHIRPLAGCPLGQMPPSGRP